LAVIYLMYRWRRWSRN